MLGNIDKAIEKGIDRLGKVIAKATIEGLEKGAKIIGKDIADKMDELHEREEKRNRLPSSTG